MRLMHIHLNRLKLLLKTRSTFGWLLWILAGSWKRLGDWQNVEWLGNHLLPKAWPNAMLHPNYITVGFIIGGFAWFTAVLLWPKKMRPVVRHKLIGVVVTLAVIAVALLVG